MPRSFPGAFESDRGRTNIQLALGLGSLPNAKLAPAVIASAVFSEAAVFRCLQDTPLPLLFIKGLQQAGCSPLGRLDSSASRLCTLSIASDSVKRRGIAGSGSKT